MSRKLNGEMATVYSEMIYNGTYEGNNFDTYEQYSNLTRWMKLATTVRRKTKR